MIWLRHAERQSWREAWRSLTCRTIWRSKTTRTDVMFTLAYIAALRIPIAAIESGAFYGTLKCVAPRLSALIPESWTLAGPLALEACLATVVTMLAIDFSSYVMHRAMHQIDVLWRIHALHHSAEMLTPLTTYRQHPLEPALLNGARGVASALGLSLLHAFFPQQTPVVTVFGLGAGFFAYMFTTNLHHCAVPVRYPRFMRLFLVSPHHHQIHHSALEAHHGHNYGVVFSLWDRLFATYLDAEPQLGELRFGLTGDSASLSLGARLMHPVAPWLARRRSLPGTRAA